MQVNPYLLTLTHALPSSPPLPPLPQCVCFDRLFCADDNHTMLLCTGIIAYIVVFGGGE